MHTCCVSREVVGFHCDSRVLFMTTALVETDRQSDTVSESDSPLSIQRFFWNTPACWFSAFKKEKREKLIIGQIQPPYSHPVYSQKAFGLGVHLVEFQAFQCQHGHLDNYAPLHFVREESQGSYQPPLLTPLLVNLVSARWYLRLLA